MKRKFNKKKKIGIDDILFGIPLIVVLVLLSPIILISMAVMKGIEKWGIDMTSNKKFDPITGNWTC